MDKINHIIASPKGKQIKKEEQQTTATVHARQPAQTTGEFPRTTLNDFFALYLNAKIIREFIEPLTGHFATLHSPVFLQSQNKFASQVAAERGEHKMLQNEIYFIFALMLFVFHWDVAFSSLLWTSRMQMLQRQITPFGFVEQNKSRNELR